MRVGLEEVLTTAPCAIRGQGPVVHPSFYKEYLKQVRWYQTIEAHQKAMRKRQV